MLHVFICEDDDKYREQLSEFINNHIMMENLDMEVAISTNNPDEIINYIQDKKTNGLYFLDIEIDKYNGVEVAQKIRLYDPRGFIVFVTAHKKYLELTFKYKVEALGYIEKNDIDGVRLYFVK